MNSSSKEPFAFWVVIPAAGSGSRMQSDIPKQYLQIEGQAVLSHTIQRFLKHPSLLGIIIALSPSDELWKEIPEKDHPLVKVVNGGESRADTVALALDKLSTQADADAWVFVHDAARPCIRREEIDLLIETLETPQCDGALLAIPVQDTLKKADQDNNSTETVCRENLWQAQTPQCFRLDQLTQALIASKEQNLNITDDASAMEFMGFKPKLVVGRSDNLKITRPVDLTLASVFLNLQSKESP